MKAFLKQLTHKEKRRNLLLLLAFLVIYVLVLRGIFAYLQSEDTVSNRMTGKNGSVTLLEPAWDSKGQAMAAKSEPGMQIPKNPYGWNDGQVDLFIRLRMTVTLGDFKAAGKTQSYRDAYADAEGRDARRLREIVKAIRFVDGDTDVPLLTLDDSASDVQSWTAAACANGLFFCDEENEAENGSSLVFYFYYTAGDTLGENAMMRAVQPGAGTAELFQRVDIPVYKADYLGVFDQPYTVTVEAEGIPAGAYPEGLRAYQPGEQNPISVEIADPAIPGSSYLSLWHIHDDGTREQVTDFYTKAGRISFSATGFSVYEIVNDELNFDVECDVVPAAGDMSFGVYTAENAPTYENFRYDVAETNFEEIWGEATQITTIADFQTYMSGGFYIKNYREKNYAKNTTLDVETGREGIEGLSGNSYNTENNNQNIFQASQDGAVKFYFEIADATKNSYYIYTFHSASAMVYVNRSGAKGLTLGAEKQTQWYVTEAGENAFSIRTDFSNSKADFWTGKAKGFASYNTSSATAGEMFYFWRYTPPDLTHDPYHLDGNTYGLVNKQSFTKGNALQAAVTAGSTRVC